MTHYADNTPCDYFGSHSLTAIGWLEPEFLYTRGEVGQRFLRALVELEKDPFEPVAFTGPHACGFCLIRGSAFRSAANIFVPDSERLFVAPSMIPPCTRSGPAAPARAPLW